MLEIQSLIQKHQLLHTKVDQKSILLIRDNESIRYWYSSGIWAVNTGSHPRLSAKGLSTLDEYLTGKYVKPSVPVCDYEPSDVRQSRLISEGNSFLKELGVEYFRFTDFHYRITLKNGQLVDYWITTQKWRLVSCNINERTQYGNKSLVRFIHKHS